MGRADAVMGSHEPSLSPQLMHEGIVHTCQVSAVLIRLCKRRADGSSVPSRHQLAERTGRGFLFFGDALEKGNQEFPVLVVRNRGKGPHETQGLLRWHGNALRLAIFCKAVFHGLSLPHLVRADYYGGFAPSCQATLLWPDMPSLSDVLVQATEIQKKAPLLCVARHRKVCGIFLFGEESPAAEAGQVELRLAAQDPDHRTDQVLRTCHQVGLLSG